MNYLKKKLQAMLNNPAWNGVLYDAGNEYSAITGGFRQSTILTTLGTGSTKKNASNLYCYSYGQNGGSYGFITNNLIDLTNYTSLYATYSLTSSGQYARVTFGTNETAVASKRVGTPTYYETDVSGTNVTQSIDISALTSTYVFVNADTATTSITSAVTVYKVWLE